MRKVPPIDQTIRTQLIVPEQVELFDYWASKRGERNFPRRADIHPAEMRALLPSLSLLDVLPAPRRAWSS